MHPVAMHNCGAVCASHFEELASSIASGSPVFCSIALIGPSSLCLEVVPWHAPSVGCTSCTWRVARHGRVSEAVSFIIRVSNHSPQYQLVASSQRLSSLNVISNDAMQTGGSTNIYRHIYKTSTKESIYKTSTRQLYISNSTARTDISTRHCKGWCLSASELVAIVILPWEVTIEASIQTPAHLLECSVQRACIS